MTSRAEEIAASRLRSLLAQTPWGATIEDSDDFSSFQSAMERVIPSMLEEEYPWWRYESLDAFLFAIARKVGPQEAEFIKYCRTVGRIVKRRLKETSTGRSCKMDTQVYVS